MKCAVKKIILAYNILALPFLPLVVYAFSPEGSFLSSVSSFFNGWLTLLCVAILLPFQYLLIPQILAAVLICLYLYRILRDRAIYPIRRELPTFLTLSFWTILSAICILLGYMAFGEGSGAPRV